MQSESDKVETTKIEIHVGSTSNVKDHSSGIQHAAASSLSHSENAEDVSLKDQLIR